MSEERDLREAICRVGRRLDERFFVAANDGNISARLEDGTVLVTPTGVSKGQMSPDDLILLRPGVSAEEPPEVLSSPNGLNISSETPMHLAVYRERSDVWAALHAHPPTSTGFAIAGVRLDEPVVSELIITVGRIPLVPYATPAGQALAGAILPYLRENNAFLLANHGVLTLGRDLTQALFRLETIELVARQRLAARLLGGEKRLSEESINELEEISRRMQGK